MITFYKAFDGKIFEDKDECEIYESTLAKNLEEQIEFYTSDGISMPITPESLRKCSYIYIKNEKALEMLNELGDHADCAVPCDIGLWRWNICDWTSLEEDLYHWMNIYPVICKVITNFKNY